MEGRKHSGVELMEKAPVSTAIIKLAIPMMVAMLAQAIFNITDIFFIGQTGNPNMVAAVSLAFPVYMLAQAVGNIFATGGSSYISRMLGAKKSDIAVSTASVAFLTAVCVGAVLSVILLIFRTRIIWMIGASEATFRYTNEYYSAVVLSIPFAAGGAVMSGLLRSEGDTKKAMTLQLVGIGTNIVLDPIMILWLGWGTTGAGLATVIAQICAFTFGIRYFLKKETMLSIFPKDFKPNKKMIKEIMSIGLPAGLSNLVMSFANILVNRIAVNYGDHVVAGNGVQMRVGSLIFLIVFALVMGYQPFAGYNYGAKQFDRLRKGFKLTMIYSSILCIVGFLALRIFGPTLIGFFINDQPTIEAGATMLRIFSWALPFMGVQVTIMISFQALGKPIQALTINLGRQLVIFVPLLFILHNMFGYYGFIWTQPISDILTTGVALLLGISLRKLMKKRSD